VSRAPRWRAALTVRRDLLAFLAVAVVTVLVCLRPVLHSAGWPVNHDGAKMFFRTEVFAAHFSQGDLLPVWSGSDAFDFGTPMPTYYQRLYFSLAGLLYLLVGDLKGATLLALGLLMLLGALGMRAAVSVITTSRALQLVLPAAFLLSNYAYTDWLVRGAAAEFSAMMLVPWLLWWSIALVVRRHFSWWIVAIFPALFYAHNAIALVATPVPLLAFVVYLVRRLRAGELGPELLVRPALSALATAGLVLPALFLQLRMNRDFDPTTKITQDFTIAGGFRDARDYLVDRDYTWLTSGGGYTVQLNLVSWLTLVAVALLAAGRFARRRPVRPPQDATLLVLVALAGYGFLQLRISQSTYDALPLLPQIQFPWRMLTLITPLLLLGIALLCTPRERGPEQSPWRRWWAAGAALWLAAYLLVSPAVAEDKLARLATLHSTSDEFYESGEYTPRTRAPGNDRDLTGGELQAVYTQLRTAEPACGLRPVQADFEELERRFEASCPQAGTQPLPLTYSSYTQVWVNDRLTATLHDPHDPRLLVPLPEGAAEIRVREPTVWRVLRGAHL
jgi:hypothetical protein